MWKQVQSMIVKHMRRMRAARAAIQNGRAHKGNAHTRDNMAIPDIALPVVQVGAHICLREMDPFGPP
jgi:hypothetical protein